MVSDRYVNLALINHESIPNSWDIDDFMKSTLHGTVDDLHFEKQTIGLENIFKPKNFLSSESLKKRRHMLNESVDQQFGDLLQGLPGTSDRVEMTDQLLKKIMMSTSLANSIICDSLSQPMSAKDEKGLRVLLDGAPGVGKTTFCHNACKDWADNKVFTDFKLAVYVPLREDQVASAVEIEHLFCYGQKSLRQAVASELEDTDGEDVLLVLDGWDELHHSNVGNSLFFVGSFNEKFSLEFLS
jgi:predicted NACHT family NTPase